MAELLTRIRVAARRPALDRQLADGVDPAATPELWRRAQALLAARTRRAIAAGLEGVVEEAVQPARGFGAAVPIDREQVLTARAPLLQLAAVLRAEQPPAVRAVAVASLLLTDGSGPVFSPHPPGTLWETAVRASYLAEAG